MNPYWLTLMAIYPVGIIKHLTPLYATRNLATIDTGIYSCLQPNINSFQILAITFCNKGKVNSCFSFFIR